MAKGRTKEQIDYVLEIIPAFAKSCAATMAGAMHNRGVDWKANDTADMAEIFREDMENDVLMDGCGLCPLIEETA